MKTDPCSRFLDRSCCCLPRGTSTGISWRTCPRRAVRLAAACFLVLPLPFSAWAAPITDAEITEFVANNREGKADEDGDRSDWLEIWNASGVAGDLGGWYLSDDSSNLKKWTLPAIPITSGGYVLVFASGKDRTDPAGEPHTNFRIQSGAGGYLALVKPDGVTIATVFENYPEQFEDKAYGLGFETDTPVTFFVAGAQAKWHVPSGPVAGWTETDLDDVAWSSGATGIGFDSGSSYDDLLGEGGDVAAEMRAINSTVYIRIPFEVPDPKGLGDLVLRLKWEDGFVAHLNGTEFHRESAPQNPAWDSSATDGGRNETDAQTFFDYAVDHGGLVLGTNVLAIQGLNERVGSSDVLFVPELVGIFQDTENLVSGFFPDPTPGAENGVRYEGIVGDTRFSAGRGFYEGPIDVTITTVTEEATIRYTLDGTPPDQAQGTIYAGPVRIAETTVLRALAYKAGYQPTNIDTLTYIFPKDVVDQPRMRASITEDETYGPQMTDSLKAVPTISLVTENTRFLNQGASNIRDEHQASVEMIFPDGTPGFQEDGGLSNYGGRYTNFPKKSFRVAFRLEFGATKLKFPIFDGFEYEHFPPADEFDTINLRSGSHDMVNRGAYMSNRFTDDSMLDMGNIGPHGRFVHVYLNGLYWGQYHLRERWNADMASSYFGGSEDDYEAVNANDGFINDEQVYDGEGDFWRETKRLVRGPDPFTNAAEHIDIANIVDFMLLWVSGNCESEFRSFGSESRGVPFKFMIKDADGYLNVGQAANHPGPLRVMTEMRTGGNPDYAILLADRIHKHFFNDGALTSAKNIERLQKRVDEARLGFISESARWGFRTPKNWESTNDGFMNRHLRTMAQSMIGKFKRAGMYPDIIAPVYSEHGGSVPPGAGITMSTNALAIYYTFDGSDPRLPGGAISPEAILAPFTNDIPTPQDFVATGDEWKYLDDGSDQGTAWRARGFDDSIWKSGPSELGYGDTGPEGQTTVVDFVDIDPVASADQRNATTYFRKNVTLSDPESYSFFVIKLKYDDGAAVYANGTEVVRTENLPENAAFDTYATDRTPSENTHFEFTIPSSMFVDGENTLAVEIHNERPGSSDISFDLILRGEIDTTNGNNITKAVVIPGPSLLNARAYNSGTQEWSALNAAFFTVNTVPADKTTLVISEFHYHPAEPATPEELAVSTDRDDYEFVEVLNTGSQSITLGDVSFSDGILFDFPRHTILNAGARIVIVRHEAAFTARYGPLPKGVIAGQFSGRLSNAGERVTLTSTSAGALHDFTYDDQVPWPALPDGGGPSMVLVAPSSHPDHAQAASWRSHPITGGAPGVADSAIAPSGFLAWKNANGISNDQGDDDGDGVVNFVEYAMGTPPRSPSTHGLPRPTTVRDGGEDFPAITFQMSLLATDVTFEVESSTDLATWITNDAVRMVSMTPIGNGETATSIWRSTAPLTRGASQYLRVRMSLTE
jgi:hypothetical protein